MGLFMIVVGLVAFAEVWICPVTYTQCSIVSVKREDPKIMSLIPLAYAMGFCLGGFISKYMAKTGYEMGFLKLSIALAICGAVLGIALFQRLPSQSKIT